MLAIEPAVQGIAAVGTASAVLGALPAVGANVGATISAAEGAIGISSTLATSAVTQAQTYALTLWDYLKQMAVFAKQQSTNLAIGSYQTAKGVAMQAKNRAGQIALDMKNEAKSLYRDARQLSGIRKTLKFIYKILKKLWPIFKWIWILTKLMNNLGVWIVRVIDVLIYRLFHIKDCFLWYTLEIIGFILYVPMEFIVWLFCLKSLEKSFWKLVDDFDCMIEAIIGFHIFHYSDTILKKCYSKKFPPVPYAAIPFEGEGEFTEKAFIKFVADWFLPPSPQEISEATHTALNLMRENSGAIKEAGSALKDEIAGMFPSTPSNPDELKNMLGNIFSI